MIVSRRQFVAGSAALALVPARAFAAVDENQLRRIAHRELSRNQSTIWLRDTVGIADFSRPSSEPRFFVVDMISGQVRPFLVAHGRGSDPEHEGVVRRFSNEFESLASSRGAFLTHTWYEGIHGPSMRLYGLDPDNSNAEARAIVVHGAWYANPDMIEKWGKLGRSDGCFAFPEDDLMQIIARVGPGRLIFSDKLSDV
ncbi:MAG: murein L,D-transpeptidase catalytic domain family protein [Sphingomonadaceae bacterium]|jgi:hypothetical protein